MRPERAFLALAASFFVFHQIGSVLGSGRTEAAVDVLTPFAVVAASAAVLYALRARGLPLALAIAAATAYVHGVGVHLAANSIHNEGFEGDAVYFWDERFSHIEAVLGWFGLLAALCLAERAAPREMQRAPLVVAALLLGCTLFTGPVEGQTWWMELPAAAAFAVWALRSPPRPLLRATAAAFVLGALLIGAWAVWHGGVPEFSAL